ALASDVRRGRLSRTVPSRGSTLSRIDRAWSKRRTTSRRFRPPAAKIRSELAVDKVVFEVPDIVFGYSPAAGRFTGLVNRLAVARDEIMPIRQRRAGRAQAIGA